MVYSNRYAYDSRRGQSPTYGYSVGSTIGGYEDHNSYTLRVMPYDEDMREDFIDLTQSSRVPYLLIAIIVILFLLCVV